MPICTCRECSVLQKKEDLLYTMAQNLFSFFGILFIPLIFEKRDFSAHLGILPSVFLSHENLGDKRDENKANILKVKSLQL